LLRLVDSNLGKKSALQTSGNNLSSPDCDFLKEEEKCVDNWGQVIASVRHYWVITTLHINMGEPGFGMSGTGLIAPQ
jgi:hypothetical protein